MEYDAFWTNYCSSGCWVDNPGGVIVAIRMAILQASWREDPGTDRLPKHYQEAHGSGHS